MARKAIEINNQHKEVVLKKGAMLSAVKDEDENTRIPVLAVGKLLNPNKGGISYRLREEEVPRVGVKVLRVIRRCRWIDGSTHLWIGRIVKTGTGEGSSGLRFDIVKEAD